MRFKDFLSEMSYYAVDVERKITSIMPKLIEHIIKYWYCVDREPEKHWLNEVRKFANIILNANDTKPDSKPFSYKKCITKFSSTYDDYKLENDIYTIKGEYDLVEFNERKAYDKIQKLFDNMWKKMAKKKFYIKEFIEEVERFKK